MKVSVIIACLALVPFVLAQAPVEPAEQSLYDRFTSFVGRIFESAPVVNMKEKTQIVFDKVQSAHDQMNEFLVDIELDPITYGDGTYSVDEIQNKINELSASLQTAVEGFFAQVEAFDLDSLKFDVDSEPEGEAEPEAEETPRWWLW